jgi:hypothetical protein
MKCLVKGRQTDTRLRSPSEVEGPVRGAACGGSPGGAACAVAARSLEVLNFWLGGSLRGPYEVLVDVGVGAAAGHLGYVVVAEAGHAEGKVASLAFGELGEGAERVAGFELVVERLVGWSGCPTRVRERGRRCVARGARSRRGGRPSWRATMYSQLQTVGRSGCRCSALHPGFVLTVFD